MFDRHSYQVVKNAISQELAEHIVTELKFLKDIVGEHRDTQVPEAWSWYSPISTEALLVRLQPLIEDVVGKTLFPCYSYVRMYENGAFMEKHYDRKECEYSASITLSVDKDHPWSLWIDDKELSLDVGDLVVYKGHELEHWRLPYTGQEQTQTFLHYVDANGEFAYKKFDERNRLCEPGIGRPRT